MITRHVKLGTVELTDNSVIYPENDELRALLVTLHQREYGRAKAKTDYTIFFTKEQVRQMALKFNLIGKPLIEVLE